MPADTAQLGASLARLLAPYLPAQDVAPAVQAALRDISASKAATLSPEALALLAVEAVKRVLPPPYNMAAEVAVAVGKQVLAWADARPVSAPGMVIKDERP